MVRIDGEASNQLFEILEQWNTALKGSSIDLKPDP